MVQNDTDATGFLPGGGRLKRFLIFYQVTTEKNYQQISKIGSRFLKHAAAIQFMLKVR